MITVVEYHKYPHPPLRCQPGYNHPSGELGSIEMAAAVAVAVVAACLVNAYIKS